MDDTARAGLNPSLYSGATRKLREGTEVLRTGGGATLTAGECGALLDELDRLRAALGKIARGKQVTVGDTTYVRPGQTFARDVLGDSW